MDSVATMAAMLPSMRQRLTIAAAITFSAALWLLARSVLTAADGSTGLTLTASGAGVLAAILVTLLISIPIAILMAVVSAGGHPLSGLFAAAASLIILTGMGGPIDGWLRTLDSPAGYRTLAFEMILWQVGAMGVLTLGALLRPWLRNRWSWLSQEEHVDHSSRLLTPSPSMLMAGLVTAVVAGIATMVLLRSSDTGQVIGGLLVAFTAGGLAGQSAFPAEKNPLGMLMAPAIVACVAYLYVSMNYSSSEALLTAFFNQATPGAGLKNSLPPAAMALPIHYISAGLTGTILGIGLGQTIHAAQKQATQATA